MSVDMPVNLPHSHHHKKNIDKIYRHMPEGNNFLTVAGIMKLLGDPTRLQLFWILCHTEECVINLAAILDVSSPAISHHIRFLRDSELIVSRKDGKEVYYRSSNNETARLLHVTIEKIMKTACPVTAVNPCDSHEHICKDDSISQIHDYLLDHLHQRVTINELSRRFLMNPTTLKLKFKDAYGHSIAAHMKAHRMEKAAGLLTKGDASIAEISSLVGYASQSKFSRAFAEYYGVLPLEYRKKALK